MYALSIGHLLKTAKDSSVEKLFAKMKTWYMEKDDDASRLAVALTFQVLATHSTQTGNLVFFCGGARKVLVIMFTFIRDSGLLKSFPFSPSKIIIIMFLIISIYYLLSVNIRLSVFRLFLVIIRTR